MTGSDWCGAGLRVGVRGAARIAPAGVIRPARRQPGVTVAAVAARDPERAARFARDHDIPRVAPSYQALVDDSDIDAIYNPLPNGLHAEWTLKALESGKHVLCEKPITANATEAERVAAAAERKKLVVMEAFHYRYHPLAKRAVEIASSGELGTVRRVEAAICFPLPRFSDIRYRLDLAGGATMDAGCYAIHLSRVLGAGESTVTSARAKLQSTSPGVPPTTTSSKHSGRPSWTGRRRSLHQPIRSPTCGSSTPCTGRLVCGPAARRCDSARAEW